MTIKFEQFPNNRDRLMLIRPYLRASTTEQNANRAKAYLKKFVHEQNLANGTEHKIATWYIENASGAKIDRDILNKLLDEAETGDVLLVESVDRLTRLNNKDWDNLNSLIKSKKVRVVSVDLPTSFVALKPQSKSMNEYTDVILNAINSMLLDILAATARKDYEDRKNKQSQGIEIAKNKGKYKGRKANEELHKAIITLSKQNNDGTKLSINEIAATLKTSKSTVCRVRRSQKSLLM